MRIENVQALPVSLPVVPFADAYGTYDRMNYVIVKIRSDSDIVGLGEASPIDPSFYGETQQSIITIIERWLAPVLRGQDPLNVERIESLIDHRVAGNTCAKAAVDMAIYDLTGKQLGIPVNVLFGGLSREKVAVALELGITSPEQMDEVVSNVLKMKPKAVKLHVGTTPEEDIRAIRAFHDAVGTSAVIRADANGAYTMADAINVIENVEECNLEYFEQPLPRTNLNGLAKIRQTVQTPIAVDESVWTPQEAMEVCKRNAADVINIKLTRVGGLNRAKKIADIAQSAFLKANIGCEFEFGVATAAKVQLALILENATCAATGEFTEIIQLKDNIVMRPYEMKDGFIIPNDKPGLGVELDEEKMKRYATREP